MNRNLEVIAKDLKSRFHSRHSVVWIIGALVAMTGAALVSSDPSLALTEIGPTDTRMRYALEFSSTTNATTMQIPVYYRTQPTAPQTMYIQDFSRDTSTYNVWMRVRARSAANPATFVASDPDVTNSRTFAIPPTAFAYDASSGMYRAVIDFDMRNYGATPHPTKFVHFQLRLANTSAYIAYGSDSAGGYFQAVSRNYLLTGGFEPPETYNLYMATPCDITSNTNRTVRLYDLDHRNIDNGFYPVTVRIYDVTAGEPGVLERTFNGDSYAAAMGQGGTLSYSQLFQPRHKYRMQLTNIVPRNVIQYDFPFDNIAYVVNCDSIVTGRVSQNLEVIPDTNVVETGQSLTGRFLGTSTATVNAPINYDAHIWYDTNNDGVYQAGESTVFRRTEPGTLGPRAVNQELALHSFTADIARGSRICFSWSITPADPGLIDDDPNPDRRCVYIGFQPRVSVWGNDLRVGSALNASGNVNAARVIGNTGIVAGNQRGSWVEYGIFAPSTVTRMASGSRFMATGVATAQSDWSKLTFSNTTTYGNYATGAALGVLPDVHKYFTTSALPSYITRANSTNRTVGSYLPNTVIIDSGTVTINADITAPAGPVTGGAAGVTQMVIIAAGDIRIAPNVQNVDAWLIAPNGTIETCNGVADPLSTTVCNQRLTITGPVMASHLRLRRTFGTGTEYAEIINLRADSYVWARHLSNQTGSWQTKYTTELPPRY